MTVRRFIVDTNVLIAGLLTAEGSSPTARLVDAMLTGRLFFLLSADLLREYREVLLRPTIACRHGLDATEIDQILTEITANAIWRDPPDDGDPGCPDPRDTHLWALLAAAPDTVLVTGDRRLLESPRPLSSVIPPAVWAAQFGDEARRRPLA